MMMMIMMIMMMMIAAMARFPAPLLFITAVQGAASLSAGLTLIPDPTTALRRLGRLKTWIMCRK